MAYPALVRPLKLKCGMCMYAFYIATSNFHKGKHLFTSLRLQYFYHYAEDAKRGSITGPAVGATLAVVLVVVVVLFGVILMYVYIHLRRSKVFKITSPKSGKRQLKHEISLPYLVENKGYSDADGSSRGPRILVLNAPIPVDEDRTNLEIYNSLFDEEGTSLSNHDNDTAPT